MPRLVSHPPMLANNLIVPSSRGSLAPAAVCRVPAAARLDLPAQESCWQPFRRPTNAFCVTLYNEDRAAFELTIRSLLRAMRHFHRQPGRESAFSVICLIADGREQMDARIWTLLGSTGLTAIPVLRVAGAEVHLSLHRYEELLPPLEAQDSALAEADARFIVILKDRNQGKLQSHTLFFGTICRELQPTYCYQIDIGTALEPDSVARLVLRMEEASDLGALALRILPAVPTVDDGLLVSWQYLDFALQKSVGWPFEIACGYLSVIPGQASLYRWTALRSEGGAGQGPPTSAPLRAYLRGPSAADPLSRLMFLAEDRVIGSHIVLEGSRRWQLGYAPEAGATTDSCLTLAELLRQRRRWRNSRLACLAGLPRQWWRHLMRARASDATPRWMFSAALAAQAGLVLKEFLAPAQLVGLGTVLVSVESGVRTPLGQCVRSVFLGALAWQLCLLCLSCTGRLARRRRMLVGSMRWAQLLTSGLMLAQILLALPAAGSALLLLAPVAVLVAMSLTLPCRGVAAVACVPLQPVIHLAMVSVLSGYSFWNFNDVSWGTKGLRRSQADTVTAARLKRWRNCVFSVWTAANAALAVTAVSAKGLLIRSLNPVTEVMCMADALIAMLGLVFVLKSRLRAMAV